MSETITLAHIHEDLVALHREIADVKEKILDTDEFLSEEDEMAVKIARLEYKRGKAKSLDDLEKKWRS